MNAQFNSAAAIYITFSGNCKQALAFYQSCFGGLLQLDIFETSLNGFPNQPVISGVLSASRITIRGSDLGYNEGRKVGNHMGVYLYCEDSVTRSELFHKLVSRHQTEPQKYDEERILVEVIDPFDVRWLLGI